MTPFLGAKGCENDILQVFFSRGVRGEIAAFAARNSAGKSLQFLHFFGLRFCTLLALCKEFSLSS